MLNIDTFTTSKHIKLLYRILHSPLESWNGISNLWLHKLDFKCNEKLFVCRCSNVSILKLNNIPKFYRNLIHSCSEFNNNLLQSRTIDEILEERLFCNSNITFKSKPILLASFLKSNIKTITDIWITIENDFKSCNEIYTRWMMKEIVFQNMLELKKKQLQNNFYKCYKLKYHPILIQIVSTF